MTQNIEVFRNHVSEYNFILEYSLYCDTQQFEGQITNLYGIAVKLSDNEGKGEEAEKVDAITSDLSTGKELLKKLSEGLVTPTTLLDCIYEYVDNLFTVR